MSNFIIGTAGHIDHGKTTLIKALTGHETDRLEQEKERGISIELGFTYFDLENGTKAGIVDVPGHERFLKNMLAGVSGMDMVMLVIAADEGIMKQTKEHLDILNMLELHHGIVVLTKKNLVDEDWLELVQEDIKDSLEGTFLENAPILSVDSVSGEGIAELKQLLSDMSEKIEAKSDEGIPRLPVDRIFTITGFGTVVTGTLISGTFKVGDEVSVYPASKSTKIRGIQVHGEASNEAHAGQRVALNLSNIKKSEIERGDIVAPPKTFTNTMMLDVKVQMLKDAPRIIENRTRLRLYHGAREVLCRAVVLDREYVGPGEEAYVQLRLEEEIVAKKEDRFVLRFYSPMDTIGGGVIIEPNPPKRKRFDENALKEIELMETGDSNELVLNKIKQSKGYFATMKTLALELGQSNKILEADISDLKEENKIHELKVYSENYYIADSSYQMLVQQLKDHLSDFHRDYPLRDGAIKEEMRSKYFQNVNSNVFDVFIQLLESKSEIKVKDKAIALYDFEKSYDDESRAIYNALSKEFEEGAYAPKNSFEIIEAYSQKEQPLVNEIYNAMLIEGTLIKVSNIVTYHKKYYDEAIEYLKKHISENGGITMAEFRDKLGISRKYAVAFLEFLDSQKITIREGDIRKLYENVKS
ncbi:MAG: selenocysteine-specific translation elongation factor [Tissierellales bacterium]|jgi:selenocysteine-specific elongation factor|nr:selenocysteine-specific translation elongation factor [Tissierellales bacterium]